MSDARGDSGNLPHFSISVHCRTLLLFIIDLRLHRPGACRLSLQWVCSSDCKPIILGVRSGKPTPPRFSANRFVRQGRSPRLPDPKDPEEEELNVSR